MKGINYIRKLGRGRFLEQIVSIDYVKNVYSLTKQNLEIFEEYSFFSCWMSLLLKERLKGC